MRLRKRAKKRAKVLLYFGLTKYFCIFLLFLNNTCCVFWIFANFILPLWHERDGITHYFGIARLLFWSRGTRTRILDHWATNRDDTYRCADGQTQTTHPRFVSYSSSTQVSHANTIYLWCFRVEGATIASQSTHPYSSTRNGRASWLDRHNQ